MGTILGDLIKVSAIHSHLHTPTHAQSDINSRILDPDFWQTWKLPRLYSYLVCQMLLLQSTITHVSWIHFIMSLLDLYYFVVRRLRYQMAFLRPFYTITPIKLLRNLFSIGLLLVISVIIYCVYQSLHTQYLLNRLTLSILKLCRLWIFDAAYDRAYIFGFRS